MRSKELSFDEWYCLHEDEINIELAEIGANREMDFDPELEFEIRYQKYLKQNKDDYSFSRVSVEERQRERSNKYDYLIGDNDDDIKLNQNKEYE